MTPSIHVVEYHHEALEHLLNAIGSKKLNFVNNLLLHFDSHPDLLVEKDLMGCEVYKKNTLLDKVNIESWILPLLFAGHFTTVIWIKPKWANQIQEGSYTFDIGEHKTTQQIRVTSPLTYFVGAGVYECRDNLVNSRSVNLEVIFMESIPSQLAHIKQLINDHHNSYVLDIDLDHYTTSNPFKSLYSEINLYERLKPIYSFNYEPGSDCPIVSCAAREEQLKKLELIFCALVKLETKPLILERKRIICADLEQSRADALCQLIADLCSNYDLSDIDWIEIDNAGTTIDTCSSELPHHISSDEQIRSYLDQTTSLLGQLPLPKMITMSRSSLDDYCPLNKVDEIQSSLISSLQSQYDCKVNYHYKD